eukprot:132497-Pleurochrysis_carterae.AAC.1
MIIPMSILRIFCSTRLLVLRQLNVSAAAFGLLEDKMQGQVVPGEAQRFIWRGGPRNAMHRQEVVHFGRQGVVLAEPTFTPPSQIIRNFTAVVSFLKGSLG